MDAIQLKKISDININDVFFDSLRESYPGFDNWLNSKVDKGEYAFVFEDNGIQGFLYLKEEDEEDLSIIPPFEKRRRLKIGTFKINPHGTNLGERFMKIIIDAMVKKGYDEGYVTVFDKHPHLIKLFQKYGFEYHGIKRGNGEEKVFIKKIKKELCVGNVYLDYPIINLKGNSKHLLAIKPEYHTKMFPDSKLRTEKGHTVKDIPVTNNIEKIYLSAANLSSYKVGDIVVIYRMKDEGKPAYFSSVVTSLCTVIDIKSIYSFSSFEEFYDYCRKSSVFSDAELKQFWDKKRYPTLVKMLYNKALDRRIIRKELIEQLGLDGNLRWTTIDFNELQFRKILELGDVSEDIIIY